MYVDCMSSPPGCRKHGYIITIATTTGSLRYYESRVAILFQSYDAPRCEDVFMIGGKTSKCLRSGFVCVRLNPNWFHTEFHPNNGCSGVIIGIDLELNGYQQWREK